MWFIYDLVNRGVRLRSLAANEPWAKGLDADPESMEWMTAMLIAQVCAFSAQLERQSIARRTRAGLERAKAEEKRLGRPPVLDERPTHCHPAGSGGGNVSGSSGPKVRCAPVHAPRGAQPHRPGHEDGWVTWIALQTPVLTAARAPRTSWPGPSIPTSADVARNFHQDNSNVQPVRGATSARSSHQPPLFRF